MAAAVDTNEVTLKISEAMTLMKSIISYNMDLARNRRAQRWEEPVVPYLRSHPGTGKTSSCWQVAKELGIEFRGFIGAQYDPAEMAGFVFFDKDTRATWRAKPDFLPKDGEWLVLCDEFAQMSMMQKNIMAQLIQERRLGEHELSPYATLMLAGNRAQDRAGVQPDPTHVTDRVFYINMVADREEWCLWALRNGIRPEIVSYIKFRPKFFDEFDPAASKNATPRGWAKVSTFLQMGLDDHIELASIQGQVGPGPASDFAGYLRVYRDLPDVDQVIANPVHSKLPDLNKKPDVVYALCGAVAGKATVKNISNIVDLSERLPGEFAVMMMKDCINRDNSLAKEKSVVKWLSTRASKLVL